MMIEVEGENGMMVLTGKTQKDQKTIKHLIDQDQEGIAAHHKVVQDQDETGIEIGITEKGGNAKLLVRTIIPFSPSTSIIIFGFSPFIRFCSFLIFRT
jgi:hypothetical protein